MRISLRQQLAALLVLSGAIGLAVLAVATWVTNHAFVLSVSSSRLEIAASLKAAQVAYTLELMQLGASFLTTRPTIQEALSRYNNGSDTSSSNWDDAIANLQTTLSNVGPGQSGLVLQCEVFAANVSGPAGTSSVMNVTGTEFESITLPWPAADGKKAYLGEAEYGYPKALYPNLTIEYDPVGEAHAIYNGVKLGVGSTLVLGPININNSFALLSFTLPIVEDTTSETIVGWATVVADGKLIRDVVTDQRGLGETGQTLLLGPMNSTNIFTPGYIGNESTAGDAEVHYLIPLNISSSSKYPSRIYRTDSKPFMAREFPAVQTAIAGGVDIDNDVGSLIHTHNEANKSVAVGFSTAPTVLVDWIVVVEQAHSVVWQPINQLRTIIVACLFGVMGFMCIVSFPLAHWAVLPIMRLRAATEQTIAAESSNSSTDSLGGKEMEVRGVESRSSAEDIATKEGFFASAVSKMRAKKRAYYHVERRADTRSRVPGKVPVRKYWIKDEMQDLVLTFNEMSDELCSQYTKLEERVRDRTIELEHSKKAAEAANESKTLFVANVSHELRTPLNGILGLTACCMEEDDGAEIKKSLGVIYKSGDLLLRTLTDLLNFSTNQVGHQALTLEDKEFVLRDLETQTMALFGEQAKDNLVDLRVVFEETAGELYGSGRLCDITVYADLHRILQVIINLISNSLKFTPAGGCVTLKIKCLTELPSRSVSVKGRKTSLAKQPSILPEGPQTGTANFINPREITQAHIEAQERTKSPPAGKDLVVQLQVQDTGPGVEEEMLTRIFEPFVQADAGLSRKHSGTGLGLSISSQLVGLMGGTIGLESKLGEGCLFTVKLPLRLVLTPGTPRSSREVSRPVSLLPGVQRMPTISSGRTPECEHPPVLVCNTNADATQHRSSSPERSSPQKRKSQLPSDQPSGHKRTKSKIEKQDFSKARVLVAEDNRVNQEVITRMLKLEKISNVTVAADGNEAVDLTSKHAYDLIFMDVQMPNLDGIHATKLIRAAGFKIPIVALTAFADQSNIDECYGSGMDFFLSKPIKRPLLKKVLADYYTPALGVDDAGGADSTQMDEKKDSGL